ncbi:MAG: helix-turn-helix domain-containing protein [archaeon]|jgi:sugar-specific transcriptional regulator TrmB
MDLKVVLEEFGLNPKEAELYLIMHKNGHSTAAELSKKTSILRQTVYDVLDKMISKGIVSQSTTNDTKVFAVVDPKVLLQMLENKRKMLTQALPEFADVAVDSKNAHTVQTFVGYKGLKSIWDDMLVVGKDTYFIIDYDVFGQLFKELFIQNFIAKRIEKGFWHHVIFTSKTTPKIYEKSEPERLRDVRYLLKLTNFKSTVFFYGDKMGFFTTGEQPSAILIENKDAVASMRSIFKALWEESTIA